MTLYADAVATLEAYAPTDPGQRALRQAFLGFLAARSDAMHRSCAPGHLTASAVVVDPAAERVLLTLHPRVGSWVQLGGHLEPGDATLTAGALREATEESGIAGLAIDAVPLHLDVHPITCSLGVPTRHFDVRFLVRSAPGALPVRSHESLDLAWFGFAALPTDHDTIPELVGLARQRLAAAAAAAAAAQSAPDPGHIRR